jgi:hypothetical protein
MRAFRPIVLALTTGVMLFTSVAPASAVSTGWDPDDQSGVIDLRWVGVVRIDADTVRITITTWDPVRGWVLKPPQVSLRHAIYIMSKGYRRANFYGEGYVHLLRPGHWRVTWYDGGSQGVVAHFRATHPTPTTFQVFLPAAHLTAISVHACNQPDEPPPGGWVCGAFESDDRIPAEGHLLNPA